MGARSTSATCAPAHPTPPDPFFHGAYLEDALFAQGSDYHASTDGVTGKPGQSHTPSRGSTPSGNVVGAPSGGTTNNYSRAEGQNVGNFITDRNSSRVLAPPGGASQITFG